VFTLAVRKVIDMGIAMNHAGFFATVVLAVAGVVSVTVQPGYSWGEQIVTDLRFYPVTVRPGASVTATFFGADYSDSAYFDVRFRRPGSDLDDVALNWQRGTSSTHVVPGGTFAGTWIVTGVRPHENPSDHTADFIPVSAPLTVTAPAAAPSAGKFTPTNDMSTQRMYHTATLLPNGRVLIAGGHAGGYAVWATAELYDPSNGTFGATGSMTKSRTGHTATLLPDGKVLIAGGAVSVGGTGSSAQASAEVYDPVTGRFRATGDMTIARRSHTATLLHNGKVLITGGVGYSAGGAHPVLGSAELYDPSSGTFTPTGSMKTPFLHTATLLGRGKVLISSHFNYEYGNDDLASAELYDPENGTFSLTGKTTYPFLEGLVTSSSLLPDGRVLNTLANACEPDDYAEVYDPSTERFSATGNMTQARGYSRATLLPEGKVLVAGREYHNLGGSAELYDPVTGKFSTTGEMLTHREEGFTATLLPDGSVLMSGGWICCGYSIATAEIYHPAVFVSSPVLFSPSRDERGPGAILHASTHQSVSGDNPAVAGEVVEIYGTGFVDGSRMPPQVAIGGRLAEILYFGKASGFLGQDQVHVRVPSGVSPALEVPVRLTYLSRPSNEVTLAVK
jgi:hypothetical protein